MKNDFHVGQTFEHERVLYRVLKGDRCDGDMVIQFSTDAGKNWHQPGIAHLLVLTALKFEVEENNYGKHGKIKRAMGGRKLLNALSDACYRQPWPEVAERIDDERKNAQDRRNNPGHTEPMGLAACVRGGIEMTKSEWFSVPLELRQRYWKETNWGKTGPASPQVIESICKCLNRPVPSS